MGLGLDEATAATLFRHVASSIDAWKRAGVTALDSFCAKRQQIVTQEDYLREREKRTKASDDARAQAIQQIAQLVDNVAYAKIMEAGRLRLSTLSAAGSELASRFAAEPEDVVAKILARRCGPAASGEGK